MPREDWAILRALSDVLGKKLPFDLAAAAARASSTASTRIWPRIDQIAAGTIAEASKRVAQLGGRLEQGGLRLRRSTDFYLTNPIARASRRDGGMLGARRRTACEQAAE